MHIPADRLDEAYEQIKAAALAEHGAETVAIFVAPDVDAVCACKLLLTLLQTDWIPHKVVPVTSYSHLAESASDLLASHAFVRSLILINCGGITDLAPLLPNLQPHHRVYVLDSRRPLNLDNLFANELVAVLDDGHVDKDLAAEREAYDRVEFAADESDGEEDDEDEDEAMDDDEGDVDVDGSDDDDDEPDADTDPNDPDASTSDKENAPHPPNSTAIPNPRKRKRARTAETADTRRRQRRLAKRAAQATLVDYYAQGTWYGTSVAMLAFDLVHQVGRATVDAVWCAILGVTYQFEHELIAEPRYLQAVRDLDAHVTRLSPTVDADAVVPGGDLAAAVRVAREPDVRVPLYRHWTLWDALAHARGISCRLATWTPRGVDRLQFLLTKMGVPMDEYRKPFLHMDKALKDAVWTQLDTHAPLVRLDRLTCPTFVRSAPLVTPVSATDAVAALGALAVSPAAAVRAAAASSAGGNAHDDLVGATVAVPSGAAGDAVAAALLTGAPSADGSDPDPSAVFYALLDALTKPRLLAHGLAAARTLAKAIVTVAGAVVTRRAIKTMKGFRYAMIHDAGSSSASSSNTGVHGTALAHPVALRLLTLQLAGALREINRVELPLVTAVLREDGVYVVMGHVAAQTPGMVRRNMMGDAFQAAAEVTNARHRQDAFDSAVVEVAREDIGEYLEQLQVELARMRAAA
ncbi:hypothetical protein GGF31_005128 [Allomyces arbusculus]|nr:hypothetical protein GGF31_005128 [Allomyces arbusculus]